MRSPIHPICWTIRLPLALKPSAFIPLLLALALPALRASDTIGFVERFALADEREEALRELIPGTEDYYFYHALHAQNEGRLADVDGWMEPWVKRFGETERVWEIRHRQALLRYPEDPKGSLAYLRHHLGLLFNHRQERLDAKPNFPVALKEEQVALPAFLQEALRRSDTLSLVEDRGLDWVLRNDVEMTPKRRRDLLARLKHPDYPNLVGLISADLRTEQSRGFGEFPIHGLLLPEQLDELAGLRPGLLESPEYVRERLRKFLPSEDLDWRRQGAARRVYLERMWEYAKGLAPSFNSLKAHLLYRLLDQHRREGRYPRDLFLTYLRLPRPVPYAEPRWLNRPENRTYRCDLSLDFAAITTLPPIGHDEGLVRDYLLHLFVEADGWQAYSPYLREDWLKPVYAEAKLVRGVGDAEELASLLNPAAFQALRDRVDVDFLANNPEVFAREDAVTLQLDLKHVSTLIVKVYELNALNFFLEEGRELNTDLNLDGLVPNSEKRFQYDEPPLRRVTREYAFPELECKAGAWVVEFIGNGRSSRALVRKGRLQYLAHPISAGTVLTLIDENNAPVQEGAEVWFGGRRHEPDEDGMIVVPFSNQPGRQPLVLRQGELATLEWFEQPGESYQLEASFHVARETLLPGEEAEVAIRPRLSVNGEPVSVDTFESLTLLVEATDLEGIPTVQEIKNLEFFDDRETLHRFRVPSRLAELRFGLRGEVRQLTAGSRTEVLESDSEGGHFELNGVENTSYIADAYLSRISGEYVLEVVGKTGEARVDRPLHLSVRHELFKNTLNFSLKTSPSGRIRLGALPGIQHIKVEGEGVPERTWTLPRDRHSYAASHHGAVDGVIELPLMKTGRQLGRGDVALLERRGGTYLEDHFDKLSLRDSLLQIRGLAAGDYDLVLRGEVDRTVALRVTEGRLVKDYLLGRDRHLQIRNAKPLQIVGIGEAGDEVQIQLANVDPFTRVHLLASHFVPEYPLYDRLGRTQRTEPYEIRRGSAESRYLSGRDIGEEYRYILERRLAMRFPGNLLQRPALLLNPWALRDTETKIDEAEVGEAYRRSEEAKKSSRGAAAAPQEPGGLASPSPRRHYSSTLDFLRFPAPVVYNVQPDEQGIVTLKRSDLGDRQHLHVLAVNVHNTSYRQLSLDEGEGTSIGDLRLQSSLDPDKHFTQRQKVTRLLQGEVFRLADLRDSEFERYDTIGAVYGALMGMNEDPTLTEFSFLTRWPSLEESEKRDYYSRYASHELHLFLAEHDPEFFRTSIRPYIVNKKDKTFLDDYLTGAPLASYLEPWRYGRLNILERVLLARRLGAEERDVTARHVRELYELRPRDVNLEYHWFQSAIKGRSLYGFAGGAEVGMLQDAPADPFGGGGAGGGGVVDAFAAEAVAVDDLRRRRYLDEDRNAASLRGLESRTEFLGEIASGWEVEASAASGKPPAPAAPAPARKAGDRQLGLRELAKKQVADKEGGDVAALYANLGEMDADGIVAGRKLAELRQQVRAYFRQLDPTREWAENNYHHLTLEDLASLGGLVVPAGAFWRDYAAWDGEGGFYSSEFPSVADGLPNEVLLALAVLDLPFQAGQHQIEVEDASLTFTAASPVILFHEEIEESAVAAERPPVLVNQNFFRADDRYQHVGNERRDKYVRDEFLTGVLYGAQVVVTNPTSAPQRLDVLLQIPTGALPAKGSRYTRSQPVEVGSFSTYQLEYYFYFPSNSGDGDFAHYPVHVSKDEETIAWGERMNFKVVDSLSKIDKASWDYLSQYGSEEEVFAFLEANNLFRYDLARVAWRARESVDFFRRILDLLDERHSYDETLWSYGIYHNDTERARQYLTHREDFLKRCGLRLETELVSIEPVERHWYQHLEYSPLVSARAHRLGRERQILNDRFREQYQFYMDSLCYVPELDAEENLATAYYLLLQDRVEEGLERFGRVPKEQIPSNLQWDYLQAYAAFYLGEVEDAAEIAARHADHPVDRWRERFAEVSRQAETWRKEMNLVAGAAGQGGEVREVVAGDGEAKQAAESTAAGEEFRDGDHATREQQQDALASSEPVFDFTVENREIRLDYRNLGKVRINYYEMDLEFLFSSDPFVSGDAGRFRFVRPSATSETRLEEGKTAVTLPLPEAFRSSNVLVEIIGAGQRKAQPYYANTLAVQVVENYGLLNVRHEESGKPLSGAYVKVYGRLADGSVRFYKDGYTDLRGKFDYASLSTDELGGVERFSLLVLSENDGALVREAAPPTR